MENGNPKWQTFILGDIEEPSSSRSNNESRQPENLEKLQKRRRYDSSDEEAVSVSNRDSNADLSPPRMKRGKTDASTSIRMLKASLGTSDNSELTKRKSKYSPDLSPERDRTRRNSVGSPKNSPDLSPARNKNRHDDLSPHRRKVDDSPHNYKADNKTEDRLARHKLKGHSSPVYHPTSSRHESPPDRRKEDQRRHKSRSRSPDRSSKDEHNRRLDKTLSGARAGLQTASDMRAEANKLRKKEDEMFQQVLYSYFFPQDYCTVF